MLRNFFAREELGRHAAGQTLVEYAMIVALISIGLLLVLGLTTTALKGVFSTINTALNSAKVAPTS